MKKMIYFIMLVTAISLTSCVSFKKSNMDFVDAKQLGGNTEIVAVNLPTGLAKPFIIKSLKKDKESKEVITLIKGIKKVKILTLSNPDLKFVADFEKYKSDNNLEELLVINSEGDEVKINAIHNKDIINRLLLEVKSNTNEIVYVDLKGKFNLEDLSKLASQ
ncbi:DUF4252 domain-containing protein [Faecalibacter rhinopitheci]|uniref:DUF4252 domain-containing protein n=1 Tax=Faecalibacter rhinopitheci TaxID=2779678 RepID=A0A8J7KIP4_9FLAO|nr:DUF4252 domain-containing protein [Faecalibacter rhinopitheci]MBF0598161.1 DUF4252 domain-containing protein [Faecalibacter rhinopitheci]